MSKKKICDELLKEIEKWDKKLLSKSIKDFVSHSPRMIEIKVTQFIFENMSVLDLRRILNAKRIR